MAHLSCRPAPPCYPRYITSEKEAVVGWNVERQAGNNSCPGKARIFPFKGTLGRILASPRTRSMSGNFGTKQMINWPHKIKRPSTFWLKFPRGSLQRPGCGSLNQTQNRKRGCAGGVVSQVCQLAILGGVRYGADLGPRRILQVSSVTYTSKKVTKTKSLNQSHLADVTPAERCWRKKTRMKSGQRFEKLGSSRPYGGAFPSPKNALFVRCWWFLPHITQTHTPIICECAPIFLDFLKKFRF